MVAGVTKPGLATSGVTGWYPDQMNYAPDQSLQNVLVAATGFGLYR